MNIPELIRSDSRLWKWANAMISNDNWAKLAAMAKAHLMNSRTLTHENQAGINMAFEALVELTDTEPKPIPSITSGLSHDIDDPKGAGKTQEPKTDNTDNE